MNIVVSGGGTGGHIYPALAFIKEVKKYDPHANFLYIGTENGLEKEIVAREGIPFKAIKISGFKRKLSFDNVKTVYRFFNSFAICKKLLKEFQADVVIGTGGYVSGPVVYAASRLGIPTIIHEQNSVPGLTNKFLAKYVDKVAISFESSKKFFPEEKVVLTGNPRAQEVIGGDRAKGKSSLNLTENVKSVLIFGGSRGARPINESVLSILDELSKKPYQIVYVTGEVHYKQIMEQIGDSGRLKNIIIKPFIHQMPDVLAAVDLIVSRAGATTLAEITALGLPSILIPSPYVTANHQEANARTLSERNAAVLLLEQNLTGHRLLTLIDQILLNPETLKSMSEASFELGVRDAAKRLYQVMNELAAANNKI
ncbi:undecaprenyldiphospho-muramoylpentapeptide beta-N-acetylglucosaminyltransferase [Aeribacillus sp. FSL K6-8394]|uniref:undecaprenyldiphospho-muramoylpentapeptide beta-N-acetylglucosaminyltransferase n=1 Tax=Aeribacillus sp. FSL K6-8394 TaxID=2954570 RepID=UPI0030F65141